VRQFSGQLAARQAGSASESLSDQTLSVMETLLRVENLQTHFITPRGVVKAVNGVNLRVQKGEILGIVGESGSGKSVMALMNEVQLPAPASIAKRYPFQLSGGMKQRISIAMALMCEPDLLIADEPTTALDVTIQAQILELIRKARRVHGTSVIFITHDLGVIAQLCDTVTVMYAGKIIEYNTVEEIFRNPRHPYTRALHESNPVFGRTQKALHAMKGQPPDLAAMGDGCAFAPRCSRAVAACHVSPPPTIVIHDHFHYACAIDGVGELTV
jgi:oligopeptide/dipeptide ABC transporter ATP-binding protein